MALYALNQFGVLEITKTLGNIKVSDKMPYIYSADRDQTAPEPEGAVWSGSTLFAIPQSILSNWLIKKQNLGQNSRK